MKSILQENKECFITGMKTGLEKHHIFFGTSNREISDKNGFWVWLVGSLHNKSSIGVHFNRGFDLQLKVTCQKKFEETHSREDFMKLIGKSYL